MLDLKKDYTVVDRHPQHAAGDPRRRHHRLLSRWTSRRAAAPAFSARSGETRQIFEDPREELTQPLHLRRVQLGPRDQPSWREAPLRQRSDTARASLGPARPRRAIGGRARRDRRAAPARPRGEPVTPTRSAAADGGLSLCRRAAGGAGRHLRLRPVAASAGAEPPGALRRHAGAAHAVRRRTSPRPSGASTTAARRRHRRAARLGTSATAPGRRALWRRASSSHAVSTPQLFIEGNRRTALLLASYLLARGGLPPVVVTAESYPRFDEISERAVAIDRRGFASGIALTLAIASRRPTSSRPPPIRAFCGSRLPQTRWAARRADAPGAAERFRYSRPAAISRRVAGSRPEPPMPSTPSLADPARPAACAGARRRARSLPRARRRRRSRHRPPKPPAEARAAAGRQDDAAQLDARRPDASPSRRPPARSR